MRYPPRGEIVDVRLINTLADFCARTASTRRPCSGGRIARRSERIPIRLQVDTLMAWLAPEGRPEVELQALLDSRPEALYLHEIASAA